MNASRAIGATTAYMDDVLFLGVVIVFFAVSRVFVSGLELIVNRGPASEEQER